MYSKTLRKWMAVLIAFTYGHHLHASELMVYTSRKEHLVKGIFKTYQRETGTQIKYRVGKAGALIQALKAEGRRSRADILLTVDAGNLWFATSSGLFSPIESKILAENVPRHLRDRDNNWFGLSIRARTIVYNSGKVRPSELSTYEDLSNKKWRGRLCLRTSKKVYNQSLVAMLIHELGQEKAREIVAGWIRNTVEIFTNDTAVLKAVAAGQCDIGIVNTYYYGRLMKKDPSLKLKLFWPNQNSYGVHINVSGAGVVKHSKNKSEAIKFIEWLASKKAQTQFAQINMEYPVFKGVPDSAEARSWGKFVSNSSFNLTDAGKLQKESIKLMQEVGYK